MKWYIDRSMSYADYVQTLDNLFAAGCTTGPVQSEVLLGYAKMNRQRMRRFEKAIAQEENVRKQLAEADVDWIWLVTTEGWCGDAAQNRCALDPKTAYHRSTNRYSDRNVGSEARTCPGILSRDEGCGNGKARYDGEDSTVVSCRRRPIAPAGLAELVAELSRSQLLRADA